MKGQNDGTGIGVTNKEGFSGLLFRSTGMSENLGKFVKN